MRFSHSRVETYKQCPFKFKLRYLDQLETLQNDDPKNALILGNSLHHGIENSAESGLKKYFNSYPIISDFHINESIVLEKQINNVRELIKDSNVEHEFKIESNDFLGFIDLVEHNPNGSVNLYDFKYSNNVENYLKSPQLHIYKYYYEKQTGLHVERLFYIFIPKLWIKQKKDETLEQFRARLKDETKDPFIVEIEFDGKHVAQFLTDQHEILNATEYPKNISRLCDWCEYKEYCHDKEDYMILPSTKRLNSDETQFKKIWIYGAPFSGKTVFADKSETPINLNTDGNVKFVSMPRLPIRDEVSQEGRVRRKKFAWQVFKDALDELELGSDFKTIVVDLLEDTYEHCRLYMYDKLDIEHESDDSFRAWDKVRIEFLSTIRRLTNMDYNVILISHEDTSKDITRKTGDKITAIKPNLSDKIANKVAGMVDVVGRVIVEDDGSRMLSIKPNEVTFGGGRLSNLAGTVLPLEWSQFSQLYEEKISEVEDVIAQPVIEKPKAETPKPEKVEKPRRARVRREKVEEVETPVLAVSEEDLDEEIPVVEEEKPVRRQRRVRGA